MFGDILRNITFLPFPTFPAFRSPFLYSCFYTQSDIYIINQNAVKLTVLFYVNFILTSLCSKFNSIYFTAMYKTRNTGTENGMRGTCRMEGMFYPENVAKHSGECPQTFWRMLPNNLQNVLKHSRECRKTFWGMSSNILGNVAKHSGECRKTFWRMSPIIPGNILQTFFML